MSNAVTLHLNLEKYHQIVEEIATFLYSSLNYDLFELYGYILKHFNLYKLNFSKFKQIITVLSTALYAQFTIPLFASLKLFRKYLFTKLFCIWLAPTSTAASAKRKNSTLLESPLKRVHFKKTQQ